MRLPPSLGGDHQQHRSSCIPPSDLPTLPGWQVLESAHELWSDSASSRFICISPSPFSELENRNWAQFKPSGPHAEITARQFSSGARRLKENIVIPFPDCTWSPKMSGSLGFGHMLRAQPSRLTEILLQGRCHVLP